MPEHLIQILTLVSIVTGLIGCFYGYRIFKLIFFITGFVFGALLGATLVMSQTGGNEGIAILAGLLGGLIGGSLMVTLYFVGVFFIGAGLGALVGGIISTHAGGSPEPAIPLVFAVLGGVAAVLLQKLAIILSTSFGGAYHVVIGIDSYLNGYNMFRIEDIYELRRLGHRFSTLALCIVLLGLAGVIVQYKFTGSIGKGSARRTPGESPDPRSPAAPPDR